jgi:hypothetical protein
VVAFSPKGDPTGPPLQWQETEREHTMTTPQQLADALGVSTEEFRSRGDEPDVAPPRRGRPPKPKAEGMPPPAPPATPPAEDLGGQAESGPAATRGPKPRRPRARRPKGK